MTSRSVHGSVLEGFIRAAEQDDLLLYVTAAVGIFMPGCVYMFYQYAHGLYSQYAERRESKKREEELERTAVTIFYAEGREHTEELARQIGARLDYERPPVVNLAEIDTSSFIKYKGIGLFLMDSTVDGREPEDAEWFLDFLEDLAFDQKSTNLPCRQMRFAVLGIGDPRSGHERHNRSAKALARRLNAIGAVALCPLYYIYSRSNTKLEKQADAWASRIAEALDKFTVKIKKRPKSFWYVNDSDSISTTTEDDEDGYSPDHMECIYDSEDEDEMDEHEDEQLSRKSDDSSTDITDEHEHEDLAEEGSEEDGYLRHRKE